MDDDFSASDDGGTDTTDSGLDNSDNASLSISDEISASATFMNDDGSFKDDDPDGELKSFETPEVKPEEKQPEASELPPSFASLDEAEKAMLATLPPEAQQMLDSKFEQMNEAAAYKDEITGLIPEGLKKELKQAGLTDAQGLGNLMFYYQQAQSDPVAHILGIANQFGIDIGQNNQASEQGQEFDDPQMAQMQSQINEITAQNQQYLQQQQAAEFNAIGQQLNEFSTEKGGDGQLIHPHFETVKSEMGNLFQTNPNISLKEAYDKAVWSNSDTRQQLLNAEASKKAKAATEKAAEEAEKAKKAAKSNIQLSNGKSSPLRNGHVSIADELLATANDIGFN